MLEKLGGLEGAGWPAAGGVGEQAAGLRRLGRPGAPGRRPVKVMAVTSGKGGVGKTNVSVNLALALAELGREVLLLDADLGLANVDVLLGLNPPYSLADVVRGRRSLAEVIVQGPGGLRVVPAASGIQAMANLGPLEHAGLIRAFSALEGRVDVLVVDTAAGLSESVTAFARACQEVLVVVCDEPASITDAYALIKVLHREHGVHRFRILPNMVASAQQGRALFAKLLAVTDRFLDVHLDYLGAVPFDDSLRRAIQKQRAVVQAYPRSRAAQAFKQLARRADTWPVPRDAGGQVEFFVERLIQASQEKELWV
ncbi:MAG: MinD/ParA family protein [Gammaproteobacteria bacterium]|nr:MAG: MinD/ParA family protein [Gammaproteobacteria bacterium]